MRCRIARGGALSFLAGCGSAAESSSLVAGPGGLLRGSAGGGAPDPYCESWEARGGRVRAVREGSVNETSGLKGEKCGEWGKCVGVCKFA